MTKYRMVKKFMEDTGASKKEAANMLRRCKWDYSTAKTLYIIEKFDWNKMVESMNKFAERLTTFIENLKKGGE